MLKGSVPQGSWLGAILFIVLNNHLYPQCIMHKYLDNTSRRRAQALCSRIQIKQSRGLLPTNMTPRQNQGYNHFFPKHPIVIPPITLEGVEIERVKNVKLLGIIVTHKVTWNDSTTYICSKTSKRFYHLKQLRRGGLDSVDLLAFYGSVIRPVLEYAYPVLYTSLAIAESSNRRHANVKNKYLVILGAKFTTNGYPQV